MHIGFWPAAAWLAVGVVIGNRATMWVLTLGLKAALKKMPTEERVLTQALMLKMVKLLRS